MLFYRFGDKGEGVRSLFEFVQFVNLYKEHEKELSEVGTESPCNEYGEKEDVYHFGVILVQIITCKVMAAASLELGRLKLQLENGLRHEPSVLRRLEDPCVRGTYAYESLRTTVEFAINCVL